MSQAPPPDEPDHLGGDFPTATVRPATSSVGRLVALPATRFWWLTLAALVLAAVLVASAFRTRGTLITIRFEQGHGIKPGDALLHRGIEAGEVVSVQLSEKIDRVDVQIALHPAATGLAREGSRFWIQRPRVSLARVSGLETVVGAKYVGVQPGPGDGPKVTSFEGVESPLALFGSDVSIMIRFRDGHGLVEGDTVKYRGMTVGEVTSVELNEELERVEVGVRLVESAGQLARAGTLFWVERPDISLTGVRGLETLIGGRYIAVWPGPEDAEAASRFEGLDHAPATAQREEGGLEIVLEGPHRRGIQRDAPLTYRGLAVGHIVSVGLSADSIAIRARAYVHPAYRRLICENTQFWSISGVDLRVGLTGVQLDAETLATIAAGGVALATPDAPGRQVSTGHRFLLHDEPEEDWLAWRPRIPIGSSLLPNGLPLPQPLRASLTWTTKRLGMRRRRERHGWLLALANGRLLGPADLLTPMDEAIGGAATLEVAGGRVAVTADKSTILERLAALQMPPQLVEPERQWPAERVRAPPQVEDCLLVAGAQESHLPVSIGQLTVTQDGWAIDSSVPMTEDWHGASALSLDDGSLIGLVRLDTGKAYIALARPLEAE